MLSQLARSDVSIRQKDNPHLSIYSTSRAVRNGSRYGSIRDDTASSDSPRVPPRKIPTPRHETYCEMRKPASFTW